MFDFFKSGQGYGSIRNYGVVLKFDRFSYLSCRSFGLRSFIGFKYLSLIFLL